MTTCMRQVPEGSDRRPLVTYPLVIRMECLGEAAQKDGHTLAVRGCHPYCDVCQLELLAMAARLKAVAHVHDIALIKGTTYWRQD